MSGPPEEIRVLHVDDDPEFLSAASEFLEREDERLQVLTASDPETGLDRLRAESVDCVVSDYEMPGMDGLAFFEAVRAEFPDLPFVLFTGEGSERIAAEAVSVGVTDYLQKETGTEQYTLLANRVIKAVERAAAQREVRETRERFRKLLAGSADYIHVLEADGTVSDVTLSIEHVLGYDRTDVVGENAFEFAHPEDRERAREQFEAVLADPDLVPTTEVRVRHADGSWRWLEVKSRNLLDDPTIGGIVGNVRDVTERKEREAEVDWHRSVIEAMAEGVYVLDEEYALRFVNYRVDEVEEVSEHDWVGRPLSYLADVDVLSTAEVASVEAGVDTVLDGEADEVRVELEPAVPPDAGTVELRLTRMDADGERLVLGTTHDVTDRIEREEELRRTTERYRTLIDNFPNGGVFTFDEDLRHTLAVGEDLEDVGLTAEDVEGATPSDLYPEEIASELEENYRAALDGEANTFEQSYMGRHYRVHTLPIGDDDVEAGMAVSQNVTERVNRRRELERQNERLEEFTSVVSHDLRNPLTVLGGALEMAEETGDPEHFERCHRAVDRMEQLVGDLRTLARQGDRVTDPEPVALARQAESSWTTVETGDADLEIATDASVAADPNRLKQLFENLFRNAVEHADGSVTVIVGDLDGREGFFVADDGPGIDPADREQVFESGYSTVSEGTGFGLAIVEEIVEAHGWGIDLTESEAGGARFEVSGVERPD